MRALLPHLLLLPLAAARLTLREHHLRLELSTLPPHPPSTSSPPPIYWETVTLPIDHTNPSLGNFTNRFFVLDVYHVPPAPVFVLDTGESPGAHHHLGHLTHPASPFHQHLREFAALGIVWEHRYYGRSVPWDIALNSSTPAHLLQHLTTENALADFDVWARGFAWKQRAVAPGVAPWVVVGGSYPGMRAAFLRGLYPRTVFAAYAASAPVQARRDMRVYWDAVQRGMRRYGLGNCTRAVRAAVRWVDGELAGAGRAARVKRLFLGRGAEANSNAGFADALHMPFWNWQSSGVDAQLREFCGFLTAEDAAGGWEGGKHADGGYYARRWAAYPEFARIVTRNLGEGVFCEGQTPQPGREPDCRLDGKFEGAFSVAWTWQYCSEWGFFQHSNVGPHQLGSRYDDYRHQQEMCYRQFPDGVAAGVLPASPRTEYINGVTGGWGMRPSNVFWTGGEFDPWRALSPLSTEPWSPRFNVTQEVPECGVSTEKDTVFGYMLPDAEHCYDLRAGYTKAEVPKRLFAEALKKWLKCFPGWEGNATRGQ